MPLELREATAADGRRMAELEGLTLGGGESGTEGGNVLFPGPFPPDANGIRGASMAKEREEDKTTRWCKMVDTDVPEDAANSQMIAFAKWQFYTDGFRPVSLDQGPGSNPEACEAFFGGMAQARKRIMGDRPFFYLKTLGVHPQYQGRGIGATLLRWGLEKAQEAGLEAYLESTSAGRALYRKNGFEHIEELDIDLGQWGAPEPIRVWVMKWQPKRD